jgi:hypothetical protein
VNSNGIFRRIAQGFVLAIYTATWGVSLWTVVCRTHEERFIVPFELTAVFLLTMGICSAPDLISLYKTIVLGRVKSESKNEDKPNEP